MDNNSQNRSNRNYKTILIEPFKQLKLGMYVVALAATFVVLTGFVFLTAFTEQYQHVMEIFQVVDPTYKWELITNDVFMKHAIRLGVLLSVFIVSLFYVVFKVTHKYYGPLVSIARFVDGISKGDYSQRLVLRKGDELQQLAMDLNQMAENLEKRHVHGLTDGEASANNDNTHIAS